MKKMVEIKYDKTLLISILFVFIPMSSPVLQSGFFTGPVIKPVRGYALEIAQKQGQKRRRLRNLIQEAIFQFLHIWIVLSICVTSYESHMVEVRRSINTRFSCGTTSINNVQK